VAQEPEVICEKGNGRPVGRRHSWRTRPRPRPPQCYHAARRWGAMQWGLVLVLVALLAADIGAAASARPVPRVLTV
jgi:hypothetical protein